MGPISREDLDRLWSEWRTHVFDVDRNHDAQKTLDSLITLERRLVDREAQARAIRWAAQKQSDGGWSAQRGFQVELFDLAAGVEKGQLEVPR